MALQLGVDGRVVGHVVAHFLTLLKLIISVSSNHLTHNVSLGRVHNLVYSLDDLSSGFCLILESLLVLIVHVVHGFSSLLNSGSNFVLEASEIPLLFRMGLLLRSLLWLLIRN